MASSTTLLLVTMALASSVSMALGDCNRDTVGSCLVLPCWGSRGPTDCKWPTCVCKPGLCASNDKETCVKDNSEKLSERVLVRDGVNDTWIEGTVSSVKPHVDVKPDGWSKGYAFELIKKQTATYKIGDTVEVNIDAEGTSWRSGTVTSVKPLKVKPEGWPTAFVWADNAVRKTTWKEDAVKHLADLKHASREFAAAEQKAQAVKALLSADYIKAKDSEKRAHDDYEASIRDSEKAAKDWQADEMTAEEKAEEADKANANHQAQKAKLKNQVEATTKVNATRDADANATAHDVTVEAVLRKNHSDALATLQHGESKVKKDQILVKNFAQQAADAKAKGIQAMEVAMTAAEKSAELTMKTEEKPVTGYNATEVELHDKLHTAHDKTVAAEKKAKASLIAAKTAKQDQDQLEVEAVQGEKELATAKSIATKTRADAETAKIVSANANKTRADAANAYKKAATSTKTAAKEAGEAIMEMVEADDKKKESAAAFKASSVNPKAELRLDEVPLQPNRSSLASVPIIMLAAAMIFAGIMYRRTKRSNRNLVMHEHLLG